MPKRQTGKVTRSQQSNSKQTCSDTHYIYFIFTFIFLDGEIWIVDHFRKKTVQEIMAIFRIVFVNGTNNLNYLQEKTLSLCIHTPGKHIVLKIPFHSIRHVLMNSKVRRGESVWIARVNVNNKITLYEAPHMIYMTSYSMCSVFTSIYLFYLQPYSERYCSWSPSNHTKLQRNIKGENIILK